jgi:hypothetical protein
MIPLVLALCGLGAAVCVIGVWLHLRTLRRLDLLAREIDRRVMPYLAQHASALHVGVGPAGSVRTPETVIEEACALAESLSEVERKAEDMALGPTQNLTPTDPSRPDSTGPSQPVIVTNPSRPRQ